MKVMNYEQFKKQNITNGSLKNTKLSASVQSACHLRKENQPYPLPGLDFTSSAAGKMTKGSHVMIQ